MRYNNAVTLPPTIRITEVGPRDGLQNEKGIVDVAAKVRFINLLAASGVAEIEVSSFVNPKWVPQLADAVEVFSSIEKTDGIIYSALVPNEKGMERALQANENGLLDKIAVFTSTSETFSRKNTNATIDETLSRFRPVIAKAGQSNIPVRAYISCAVACPYEGSIDPVKVREVTDRLLELGVNEIDLADTIGVAGPGDIELLYDELDGLLEPAETTLHLHDTRGTALACAYRAMQLGVRSFDTSCGGLGGCPFAPGAAGNLATEDLVYLCNRLECDTGVELANMFEAGRHIAAVLGKPLTGRVFNADGSMKTPGCDIAGESSTSVSG